MSAMRRRTLAASVVVTVSLAELACTSSPGGETRNPPPQALDTKKPEPEPISRNPPDPSAGEVPPEEIPGDKITIEKMPNGTCREYVDVYCPPGDSCNPPPPREVPCPLPEATVAKNVSQKSDGSCWEYFNAKCPEGAKCNPPPPHEVQCPKEMELPTAKNPDAVSVRENGECYESLGNEGCPPDVRCNPPPPMRVKCPPKKPEILEEQ